MGDLRIRLMDDDIEISLSEGAGFAFFSSSELTTYQVHIVEHDMDSIRKCLDWHGIEQQ